METEEFAGKWTNLWGVRKHSMVWQLQTTQWDWSVESGGTGRIELRSKSREELGKTLDTYVRSLAGEYSEKSLKMAKSGFWEAQLRVLCSEYLPPHVSLGLIWICIPRIDFSPILHVSHSKPSAWLQRQTIYSR